MSSTSIPDAPSLTIEYALTRSEIFRSTWRSIARSPKFRNIVFLYSVAFGFITLLIRVLGAHSLRARDLVSAALWAVVLFVLLPIGIAIRGKTTKRMLTVSPGGIYTEIGRVKVQVPWNKVGAITDTPRFILIVRTNGNSFFIPNRSFSSPDQRVQFLTLVRHWVGSN